MLVLATTCVAATYPCGNANVSSLPFCDVSKTPSERATDLVGRMTTSEKQLQLGNTVPGVSRLCVPAYEYHSEALHGLRTVCHDIPGLVVTLYPQVTTMAATGNLSLISEMANVISTEGRAVNNIAVSKDEIFSKGAGLNYWGPTMNIGRDPRWGRFQESVSEDPWINGAYASAFVRGMQGDDKKYTKLAACCKHFYGYSLENSDGYTRHDFNAIISPRDLSETYLVAFKACTAAGVEQVMCSYNEVNGVPTCLDEKAMSGFLRKENKFDGMIVSDCDAIGDTVHPHNYTKSAATATALGLAAGCDQDCGGTYGKGVADAMKSGYLNSTTLDTSLIRIFKMRFKLGMFDDPTTQPYRQIPPSALNTAFNKDSSHRAAREGIVLLKNENSLLPITDKSSKIFLFGSQANSTGALAGAKNDFCPPYLVTMYEGLVKAGYNNIKLYTGTNTQQAIEQSQGCDVAIAVVGGLMASEGSDSKTTLLPSDDLQLSKAISTSSHLSGKTIGVIVTGQPVSVDSFQSTLTSVMFAGEGGQSAGDAFADVVSGQYAPSGVLPFTLYPDNYTSEVMMSNMSMKAGPGRTYRFYRGTATHEFGFGLSYTTFSQSFERTPPASVSVSDLSKPIPFSVSVTNTGSVSAAKVVQVFITYLSDPSGPIKSLFAMDKVFVPAGKKVVVDLSTAQVDGLCTFCTVDDDGVVSVKAGEYQLTYAGLTFKMTAV
eukprot:TRINITY_DN3946_c0_g1_i1.p1 TRINITY_DN3946_c0_g1~~TRINITY_DN3946_c0_g1_i1.p1  ORF type:complete len:738 (+),score=180.77 TRINITY_DN3946_c0_g1_i1:72-2216(+)